MGFWEIYQFREDYTQGYITFEKGYRVILVHRDTKYEHTFACNCIRGVINFPHDIFKKLELHRDYSDNFKYYLNSKNNV